MKTTMMAWGVLAVFLATAFSASAYHLAQPPNGNVEYTWETGAGGLLTTCESAGPDSGVNNQPVARGGVGGLCYMSSLGCWKQTYVGTPPLDPHVYEWKGCDGQTKTDTGKAPVHYDNLTNLYAAIKKENMISQVAIIFESGDINAGITVRVGSNAHACTTARDGITFGDGFRYKEALAWYHGFINSPGWGQGASGHVTLFVEQDLLNPLETTSGTYESWHDVGPWTEPCYPGFTDDEVQMPVPPGPTASLSVGFVKAKVKQ